MSDLPSIMDFDDLGLATPSHAAFQIRTGQMDNALLFFRKIGWIEIDEAIVRGPWGQARFVSHKTSNMINKFIVQLTELADDDPKKLEMTENHLAIHFSKSPAGRAASAIFAWVHRVGFEEGSAMEAANIQGTKWFVYLPALFKFAIEIV